MGKNIETKGGVAAIYRHDTQSHIIFGAIFFARIQNPEAKLEDLILDVMKAFNINEAFDTIKTQYYRTQNSFLQNGEI